MAGYICIDNLSLDIHMNMTYFYHKWSFCPFLSKVGVVIGKGGETIKYLQQQSGAKIQITRDSEHDPSLPNRQVEIMGTAEQINRAEQMVKDVLAEVYFHSS